MKRKVLMKSRFFQSAFSTIRASFLIALSGVATLFAAGANAQSTNLPRINYSVCLPDPLPTTPGTPNWTAEVANILGAATVVIWREVCRNDSSTSVFVMRLTPTRGSPTVFPPDVIIDNRQVSFVNFGFFTVPSSNGFSPRVNGSPYSGTLFIPLTVVMQESEFNSNREVDVNRAMTLIFNDLNQTGGVRVSIPAREAIPVRVPLSRRGGIDLDGQGRSAIVVSGSSGSQLLAARLVNTAFQWTTLPGPGPDFRVIAPIDFSGDGKSDLPVLRETPLNANGQGSAQFWPNFSNTAPVLLRDVRPAWDVQAVGDLDGDGFGDLVWRFRGMSPNIDDQGVSYIWFTNGTALSQVRKRGGAPLTWTLLGAADLNADGAADMVYVSPTNTMRVLMATPNRTCANLNGGSIPAGFTALKIADFTGQGRGDILIRNASTGEVRLISLNATGLTLPPYTGAPDDPNASCTGSSLSVTQTSFNLGTVNLAWTLYATGDFNGDGIYDIVWNRPDNALVLWQLTPSGGTPTIINNAGVPPANTTALPLQ
jgi:hypothetical protein